MIYPGQPVYFEPLVAFPRAFSNSTVFGKQAQEQAWS